MELIYESVEECIQAELEIRSMERLHVQKRKMNPEDKFTDLSLDLFKRICSFRPGQGDREKTFWDARRDGERVAGGLPPPLKAAVNCDDLEMAAAKAKDVSTAASEKSTAAEESLQEADEMVENS
jgi:hypothetical protein